MLARVGKVWGIFKCFQILVCKQILPLNGIYSKPSLTILDFLIQFHQIGWDLDSDVTQNVGHHPTPLSGLTENGWNLKWFLGNYEEDKLNLHPTLRLQLFPFINGLWLFIYVYIYVYL